MIVCGAKKCHRENLRVGQVKGVSIATIRQSVGYKKGELVMTRELQAALEDFKEGVNLMAEALVTIITEVAKVIDEEDIDIDLVDEGDIDKVVNHFVDNSPEEDLPELEELPDGNPLNSKDVLSIKEDEDEDIEIWG